MAEFGEFMRATGYVTDAERYGWSVKMKNVYEGRVALYADWHTPNGFNEAAPEMPVTQVSWNDACAYCAWRGKRLPTRKEWHRAANWNVDKANIWDRNFGVILPAREAGSMVGNVYEWVADEKGPDALVYGGGHLCSVNTCAGFRPGWGKWISKDSGTDGLGFRCTKN